MILDFLILVITLLIMFVPSMIAFGRNLKRKWACLAVNLLFGWTVFVWIALIVWVLLTSAVKEAPTPTA